MMQSDLSSNMSEKGTEMFCQTAIHFLKVSYYKGAFENTGDDWEIVYMNTL